jgi:NADH-ubiquinone oxidoreductase chain 1
VAETNRAPFDLTEAESELVSGFMTEHSAVIFVFFFLAEYASIVLICVLNSIFFWGGYFFDFNSFFYPYLILLINISVDSYMNTTENEYNFIIDFDNYRIIETILYGIVIGFKVCTMVFTFI